MTNPHVIQEQQARVTTCFETKLCVAKCLAPGLHCYLIRNNFYRLLLQPWNLWVFLKQFLQFFAQLTTQCAFFAKSLFLKMLQQRPINVLETLYQSYLPNRAVVTEAKINSYHAVSYTRVYFVYLHCPSS